MLNEKKGQGLSVNAIILIILGVAILVILIIGFTLGWKTLVPFIKQDNVATIVKSCETACSTQSIYDYCSKVVELKAEDKSIKTSCYLLEKVSDFDKYGVQQCSMGCSVACADVSIDGKPGVLSPAVPAVGANVYDVSTFVTLSPGNLGCSIAK